MQVCLFCGGDAHARDHAVRCDGRQGRVEARAPLVVAPPPRRFDGADYVPPRDDPRLAPQYVRIFGLMRDARWRTLAQIEAATSDPPASISAQLRHMRKPRFGGHTVNRRYLGDGLYEYQLLTHEEHANGQSESADPARPDAAADTATAGADPHAAAWRPARAAGSR